MLIVDHLNLTGQTPLRGPHPGLGPRFVDMTHAYDAAITDAARRAANEQGIALREGIYAAMCGPNYETPAEVRMLRMLGADAVGMSTVPEVLALRYLGVRVGAVSCITNPAAGLVDAPLEHTEVQRVAALSRERFTRLLTTWIEILAKDACNG
jgi:purine-nucleoside phosphorylase